MGTREIKFVIYCPFPKSHCNTSRGFKVKNDESCKKKKEAFLAFKNCSHSECQRNNRCSVLLLLHLDLEREGRESWGLTLVLLLPGNRAGDGQTKVGLVYQNPSGPEHLQSLSWNKVKWWMKDFLPFLLLKTSLLLTLLAQKQNYHEPHVNLSVSMEFSGAKNVPVFGMPLEPRNHWGRKRAPR